MLRPYMCWLCLPLGRNLPVERIEDELERPFRLRAERHLRCEEVRRAKPHLSRRHLHTVLQVVLADRPAGAKRFGHTEPGDLLDTLRECVRSHLEDRGVVEEDV